MRTHVTAVALVVWALGVATPVRAQHAGFVVFGEPDAAAASAPANHRFVHPVSAPFESEDSFVTTDIRGWFIYQDIPQSNLLGGGNAKGYALQARVALTDSLQFVAYKDGYLDFNTDVTAADGWADTAAGIKWNFLRDWEKQLHLAAGAGYEIRTGHGDVLHNDDEFRLWLSGDKGFGPLHLGANVSVFIPTNDKDSLGNSTHLSWHVHADYYACRFFSPVVEFNGYHVLDEGNKTLPFSGVDLANLGGAASEEVITMAVGAEVRPCPAHDNIALRAAYEWPLSREDDLFGYRWTFSFVYGF